MFSVALFFARVVLVTNCHQIKALQRVFILFPLVKRGFDLMVNVQADAQDWAAARGVLAPQ